MAPSAGSGWAGRRATAAHPPDWVGERLRPRPAGSTVGTTKGSGLVQMGASPHLRWVTIVVAALLAAAVPAGAQESASPDAAPSSSSSPRPDPAPVKTTPKATVVRPVPTPAATTTTVRPAAPVVKPPARTARRPVQRKAARGEHRAATPKHRIRTVAVSLPHLSLAHLTAPRTDGDAGRARRLAAGALSLLILALASAMLLAFTARVERRRVAR